ncbi:MAG TPA: hypothetical protein VJY33_12685, partial [Isosphaeraceae bacterium]|nr:hypothetical protein [Isosphaeraceae bacterium]
MNLRKFHAVAVALIASAAFVSQAHAVQITVGSPHGPTVMLTGTTNPGGTINGSGGDFQNSTIGTPPTPLPWVFCVDVLHTIAPPATFTSATVDSTTGIIY